MKEQLRVPSDTVKAVFHYIGKGKRFSANIPKIHESFYDICQKEEFKPICGDFVFDTSRTYPYSETIRYALDRLQKADLLACINPSLDEYEVTESLADDEPIIKELFSNEKDIELLQKAAKKFIENINK